MSRRKKYPRTWSYQWYEIELYKPIGKWFKRRRFYVFVTTPCMADAKMIKRYPTAKIMTIAALGAI